MKVRVKQVLFFYFIFCVCVAQNKKIDSLWAVYNNKNQPDTNRLRAMYFIAYGASDNNPDTSIMLAKQQVQLAQTSKQKKYEAAGLSIIGISFMNKGNYTNALEYHIKALKVFEEIGNKNGIAACYNNIGLIYFNQSDFPNALENYLYALKIREETGDKQGMGVSYGNIGNIYHYQSNFAKALEYYLKALKLQEEIGDKTGMGFCYNNIGGIYLDQRNYPEALKYYLKDLRILEKIDHKKELGNCYLCIGLVYEGLKDSSYALLYCMKALNIFEEIADKKEIGVCYNKISELQMNFSKYKLAVQYSDSALRIAKEIRDIDIERVCYQNLSDIYSKTKRYKEAYEYHVKYKQITDTIFSKENSKQLGDLKTKFEVEKKEAELKAVLKKENQIKLLQLNQERATRNTIIGFSILLIIMVFLFFNQRRLRQKKRALEEKQQLLNRINQHQEELLNTTMTAQEKERKRIAVELHDGLGGLLSTIKLNLDTYSNKLQKKPERDELIHSISMLDEVCADLRTISHNMMPGVLMKMGLIAATKDFVGKVNGAGNLKIHFEAHELFQRLEETTEIALFRVIQEATNNMIKHADASKAGIQFIGHEDMLTVMIEDNGKGFEIEKVNQQHGMGLKSIESRISYLGGKVTIDSYPEKGTCLIIEVPYKTNTV
jgi:two-component system NarL family sensor kinase